MDAANAGQDDLPTSQLFQDDASAEVGPVSDQWPECWMFET